jgi:acyl-phosphate glycerol 3-phosphate acyltransferase
MPIGIFIALFGYLLGSVPTGLILSKLFSKVDPRKIGSKNIGATNIFRTAGKTLGILTLVGDVLKGAVPVVIAILPPFLQQPAQSATRALQVEAGVVINRLWLLLSHPISFY